MSVNETLNVGTPDYRWLKTVARDYSTHGAIDLDDIVQEGAIAWVAAARKGGTENVNYLKQAARWRMKSVAFDGRQTGSERGHGTAVQSEAYDTESVVWHSVVSESALSAAELAYHEGEIRKAVDELSTAQREYVLLRFWADHNQPELTEHFGYMPSALWTKAKRELKLKLAHLAGEDAVRHVFPKTPKEIAHQLKAEGLSLQDIATKMDKHITTVRRYFYA